MFKITVSRFPQHGSLGFTRSSLEGCFLILLLLTSQLTSLFLPQGPCNLPVFMPRRERTSGLAHRPRLPGGPPLSESSYPQLQSGVIRVDEP